jgi:hypothetical protein
MQLLLESDHLICESWLISGHVVLRDLSVANADPELIDRAQQLLWRVERACAEEHSKSEPNKPNDVASGPPDGPGAFHPRPGWTIDQEICARRCSNRSVEYLGAIRFGERIQHSAETSKQIADEAEQTAADLDRKATDAERERAAAREALRTPRLSWWRHV